MKALSEADARKWCKSENARLDDHGFPISTEAVMEFTIPSDAGARIALVASHVENFKGTNCILVWFNDWAVWPSGQRMHIFEQFLHSYGETQPLSAKPAFLFSSKEFEDMVSFVTLGILFLWDVYIVSENATRLIFYSHDEIGWIK